MAGSRSAAPSVLAGVAVFVCLAAGVVAAAPDLAQITTARSSVPPLGIVQDDSPVEVRSDGATDDSPYPHLTAQDWVTYADHVVVATVTAETGLSTEPRKGGNGYKAREVTLRVDATLWSSPEPWRAPPRELTFDMWGWNIKAGEPDRPVRIAIEHRSRLEFGHTYLLPLRYEPASCGEGDERVAARWISLGGEAALPYDGGTIGSGEIEGRYVSAADNGGRTDLRWLHSGLRRELNGQSATALLDVLRATPAGTVGNFGPLAAPCPEGT
ncbi:MAG: hypothetical protein ACT4QG_19495 [Sporichthyaceae bacterium]